jgi:CRP/FNR family cyclic AMP-dependent transcriptional regulator
MARTATVLDSVANPFKQSIGNCTKTESMNRSDGTAGSDLYSRWRLQCESDRKAGLSRVRLWAGRRFHRCHSPLVPSPSRHGIVTHCHTIVSGGRYWRSLYRIDAYLNAANELAPSQPVTTINILKREKEVRTFRAGQSVFSEGQPGDFMYAVTEGEVQIVLRGRVLETVGEGGIFGELALLDDQPRSASAIAGTACKVAVIDSKRFSALVQQTPFFAIEVMRVMAERLRRKTV